MGKIWGIFRPLTTDLRRKKKDLQVPPGLVFDGGSTHRPQLSLSEAHHDLMMLEKPVFTDKISQFLIQRSLYSMGI